jgi:Spy/CpxP family protein refolding chaperone
MKNNYKFWVIFSLIVVFLAGAGGGILLDEYVLDKRSKKSTRTSSVRFPSVKMMAQELSLTEEQQKQIKDIFNANDKKLKELRNQLNKQFYQIRKELLVGIKNILDDDQKKKFDAMVEDYISGRRKESQGRSKHSRKSRRSDKGDKK